jgi:hypothetical protein
MTAFSIKPFTRSAVLLCLTTMAQAQLAAQSHEEFHLPDNTQGEPISFVSCPVVQDTSSVPCWFADQGSTRYYLGIQQEIGADFHPPQLNHKVLVEGRILEGMELCGAPVIHPVRISVLPELDRNCNELVPAVPGIEPPPHERGPGPSNDGLEPPEPRVSEPLPEPPFSAQRYYVNYTFDSSMMRGTVTREISRAMNYARHIDASAINIKVYRGTALLSDGEELIEQERIVAARADALRTIFSEAGFPDSLVTITAERQPLRGDGIDDYVLRRAVITVEP